MLRVEHLAVRGLAPLSFELTAGQCLILQGPSGSGKTLLLRAISDLDAVDGLIFLEGVERGEMSGPEWRSLVRYCAAEPAWWADTPRAHFPADSEEPDRLLAALGLPRAMLDRPVGELSTGERQRLALARTVTGDPRVLLLDEPTAALDREAAASAEEFIHAQKQRGRGLVVVTHDPDQSARLGDGMLTISGGRVGVRMS